jgi:RecJ-like exonuclease
MIMSHNLIHGPIADGIGELPALETLCEACNGKGQIESYRIERVVYSGGECEKCRGAGTITTEDGKRLWSFMERRRIFLS